jgi:hypothetical protein
MNMSKKNALSGQLETLISSVILQLEANRVDIIDPVYVANEIDRELDPEGLAPELKTYASTMQIRNSVRQQLAKRHDPVQKAKDFVESETADLFGNVLQPYYPIKIESVDGEKQSVYTRRDMLSNSDVHAIVKRMTKAGRSLIEHSDALRGWHQSREQVAVNR